jgi:hypothetical protein
MKKPIRERNSQSGQALVLVVLLLVAMIGMVGLAVDGGILYSARRSAQSAADNAAMAGAYALCTEVDVASASQSAATANEFDNDDPEIDVVVNYPPADGPYAGDDDFVEVIVSSQEEPSFIQILYSGAFEVSARAVAQCKQTSPAPLGDGNGLIVLNPTDPGAFSGGGTSSKLSVNGGIYVNSSHATALMANNGAIEASDGIAIVGGWNKEPQGSVSPAPVTGQAAIEDPLLTLADPVRPDGACMPSPIVINNVIDPIDPGVYCEIIVSGDKKTLALNPGLYYIEGGDFRVDGGASVVGNGVFLFSTAGALTMTGGGSFFLTAPTEGEYKGLLLFTSRTNSSTITLTGGSSSTFGGTMYSPAGTLALAGLTGSLSLDAQVIVNKLTIAGNGQVNIEYDSSLGYNPGPGALVIELID